MKIIKTGSRSPRLEYISTNVRESIPRRCSFRIHCILVLIYSRTFAFRAWVKYERASNLVSTLSHFLPHLLSALKYIIKYIQIIYIGLNTLKTQHSIYGCFNVFSLIPLCLCIRFVYDKFDERIIFFFLFNAMSCACVIIILRSFEFLALCVVLSLFSLSF